MIEGITVLNQTEIMTYPSWILPVIIGLLGFAIICFILSLCTENAPLLITCFISLGLAVFILLIGDFIEVPTGRYKYECLIDESVDFVDIYEKYEVIERKGEIWVLKDKMSE